MPSQLALRSIAAIIALLLALPSGRATAVETSYPEPDRALTQYQVDTWTFEDGLPTQLIEEILQTRDGYLWLGTQSGLVRFDGIQFTVYDKASHAELKSESINALFEASDGTLWAGTRSGGIIRYRDGRFDTITVKDGLPSNEVGAIAEGSDGVIWVGLVDSSVVRLYPDGSIQELKDEVGVSINNINALLTDARGVVWIGTRHDGLFVYENGVVTSFRATGALPYADITSFALGPDGSVWVGSREEGVAQVHGYRVSDFSDEDGMPSGGVLSLSVDPSGTVWIGTETEGLFRFSDGVFSRLAAASSSTESEIKSLQMDREGSLWIGSKTGLRRLRDSRFVTFGGGEGLLADDVMAVLESSQGVVWMGGPGGLARMAKGRLETMSPEVESIYALAEHEDGSIWVGGRDGLFLFGAGGAKAVGKREGFEGHGPVYGLYTSPDGTLWISASDGLYRHDGESFSRIKGLSSDAVTYVLQSAGGILWVGTYDGGLNRYENGRVTGVFDKEHGLFSNYITVLFEDSNGALWFGAREAGLYRMESGVLHNYRIQDGLPSDYVNAIQEDDAENLWISTNSKGLYRIAKADLVAYSRGQLDRLTPKIYRIQDGLRSDEFNGGTQPSSWKGSDGRLWFGSIAGAVAIDPYLRNETPPILVIERMLAGKLSLGPSDLAEVEPGTSRFEFDFTAPGFVAPAGTRFEYRLEGFDTDWNDGGYDRKAYYTNLRPGSYTFRLRAQNADGVWSAEEARFSFVRLPFFWETIWFRLLGLLTIFGLAMAAYRFRMRQMKARADLLEQIVDERTSDLRAEKERTVKLLVTTDAARREAEEQRELAEEARAVIEEQAEKLREMDRIKMRFFNNISHEFRTPLTLNIGPMENALTGVYGKLSPAMRRQTEVMLRNSRRLLRLINQLLDLSKLESGRMSLKVCENDLDELVEGVVLSFTPFAEKKDLEITFDLDASNTYRQHYDPINLEKVFFNLLSNAIKFTPDAGRIDVRMSREELVREDRRSDAICISVSDTGPGIPAEEVAYIFDRFHQVDGTVSQVQEGTGIGLSLVKELVDLHGGEIRVESELGVGTTFHVVLPSDTSWLSEFTLLAEDDLQDAPARGPMVEMAVFEDEADEDGTSPTLPENAPMVLVVDDSPDVREYVASCLRSEFLVRTAVNGQDGLDKARELAPDLIVSDVMMPILNGYELCRIAKADPTLARIPIILVTSKASAEDKVEGLQAGADDYVAKPFSARELIARVKNLLEMSSQQKSLRRLNTNLVESNDALRSANDMKTQLLSIASHDMKNPLTAIREFSRIIREEVAAESHLVELLDLVYDSSNEMLGLITQLLDSAALESGGLEVKRVEADLSAVTERVIKRNARMAERKGQVIHATLDFEACTISADPERLQEAIDNLVSNAIKYSPLQKGIFISTAREDDEVVFSVRDEGPGLTPEDLKRVFGKFQKLSARPTGGETSTGLGLSIVKQIVELHGGRTWADSTFGEGATFSFAIPVHREHAPDRDPVPRSGDSGKAVSSGSLEGETEA